MVYNVTNKSYHLRMLGVHTKTGITHWEEIFVPDKIIMCLEDKHDCVMSSFQFTYSLFSVFISEAALS